MKAVQASMKKLKAAMAEAEAALKSYGGSEEEEMEMEDPQDETNKDYQTTPNMGDGSINEEPEDDSGDGDISMAKEAKKKMLIQMMKKKLG